MGRSSGGGTTTSSVLTRLALGVLSALGLALALVLLGSVQADADDLPDVSDPGHPERPAAGSDGLVSGVVSTVRSTVHSTVERPADTQRSGRGSAAPTKQRTAKPTTAERRTESAAPRADRPQRRAERPAAGKTVPRADRPQRRAERPAAGKAAGRAAGIAAGEAAQQRTGEAAEAKAERSADRVEPAPTDPRSAPTVRDAVRSTVATTAGTVDQVGRTVTETADVAVAGVDRDLDRVVAGVPVVRDVLPRQVLGSATAPVTAAVDDAVATTTNLLGRTSDQVADMVPGPAADRTDHLPVVPRRDVAGTPTAHAPGASATADAAERSASATATSAPVIGGLHDREVGSSAPEVGSSGPAAGSGAADLSGSDVIGDAAAADAEQLVTGSTGGTAAGSGTSGGSAGGTGSAPAGAGIAYLSQLLVDPPGLTGSLVGTVDWVLPGSATADLGSSPD